MHAVKIELYQQNEDKRCFYRLVPKNIRVRMILMGNDDDMGNDHLLGKHARHDFYLSVSACA